jgi:hypothetical protein
MGDKMTPQELVQANNDADELSHYKLRIPILKYPSPGTYVTTGLQSGNFGAGADWLNYIGYVVQVRKDAGEFGSHMVLLRRPDGNLSSHSNQSYVELVDRLLGEAKKMFDEAHNTEIPPAPENECYDEPFTINGEYPEMGKIVEPKEDGPPVSNSPMVQITCEDAHGNKTVEVV